MIVYPNAKINLGLHIVGRRADGYHLLESLLYPIPLCDILELHRASEARDSLTIYGTIDTGRIEDNLVLRAVRAMRERWPIPHVDLYLYKHIPAGAGMGGGSADATFTLRALRELCGLEVSDDELRAIALTLGADCPFFVANTPCLASGIGEVFAPAPTLDLGGKHLVVVKPHLHISTAEAFGGLKAIGGHSTPVAELVAHPLETWREALTNDFEASLFPQHPILSELKAWLYDQGAIYASMTGSGAALYGLFDSALPAHQLATLSGCFTWQRPL